MAKKGRPPKKGHRTKTGRLSEAKGARRALVDAVVEAQPHRQPFYELIGETSAMDFRCESALGRLRMIGEAEAKRTPVYVGRILFADARPMPRPPYGISEREFYAGMKYAADVGHERFVRASPKDKPSAMAFMSARGIDTSARVLGDKEAAAYVQAFEDARAALLAATLPADARRVLGRIRSMAKADNEGGDLKRMARGFGALVNPDVARAISAAVNRCVIDDRDPPHHELPFLRRGLDALGEHYFGAGDPDWRPIKGSRVARSEWQHDVDEVNVLYADVERRIDPTSGLITDQSVGRSRKARDAPVRRAHPFNSAES